MPLIWPAAKEEYFPHGGLTGRLGLMRQENFLLRRNTAASTQAREH
jgi:hypothetical protein